MPKKVKKIEQNMFFRARKHASLCRDKSAELLYIGTRTLARFELNEAIPSADIVERMACVYKNPTLTTRYCSRYCPIGQKCAYPVEFRQLEGSVLGFVKEFREVKCLKDKLINMAEDGVICDKEIDDFMIILQEIDKLGQKIETLKLWAMSQGIWEQKNTASRAVM